MVQERLTGTRRTTSILFAGVCFLLSLPVAFAQEIPSRMDFQIVSGSETVAAPSSLAPLNHAPFAFHRFNALAFDVDASLPAGNQIAPQTSVVVADVSNSGATRLDLRRNLSPSAFDAVPETPTVMLVTGGLGFLALLMRRRSRRSL